MEKAKMKDVKKMMALVTGRTKSKRRDEIMENRNNNGSRLFTGCTIVATGKLERPLNTRKEAACGFCERRMPIMDRRSMI